MRGARGRPLSPGLGWLAAPPREVGLSSRGGPVCGRRPSADRPTRGARPPTPGGGPVHGRPPSGDRPTSRRSPWGRSFVCRCTRRALAYERHPGRRSMSSGFPQRDTRRHGPPAPRRRRTTPGATHRRTLTPLAGRRTTPERRPRLSGTPKQDAPPKRSQRQRLAPRSAPTTSVSGGPLLVERRRPVRPPRLSAGAVRYSSKDDARSVRHACRRSGGVRYSSNDDARSARRARRPSDDAGASASTLTGVRPSTSSAPPDSTSSAPPSVSR
jgi:hypothetical protein